MVTLPTPTGYANVDSTFFSRLVSGNVYQFRAGTYVIDPTTIATPNVSFVGAPNKTTTLQLSGYRGVDGGNAPLLTIAAPGVTFDGIVFDGSRASTITAPYWSGLLVVANGSNDCTVIRSRVQNSARCGIYAWGYQTPIYRLHIENCEFTHIGRPGAGNSGACVMLDGGVNDAIISRNRAYGPLTSNFLKVKTNSDADCTGTLVEANAVDYTGSVAFSDNNALGIEMWAGSLSSRVINNMVYGPNAKIGDCWGISIGGDARGTIVQGNTIIGGADNTAMAYGIEAASAEISVIGNRVSNVVCGSNATNMTPSPCHNVLFEANAYVNCAENGLAFDSGPNGIKVIGNDFIDCGPRYIFGNINSVDSATANDGGPRSILISGNTFRIRHQSAEDLEGSVTAIYLMGGATRLRATIADNDVGPYEGGTATVGLMGLEINGGQDIVLHHNHFDGARPDTGEPARERSMVIYGGDFHSDHNTERNYTGNPWLGHGSALQPLSSSEFDNFAAIDGNDNSPYSRMYWDSWLGRTRGTLGVRNAAGAETTVGG